MFERIVNDPVLSEAYNITILSRPYTDRIETTTDDDDDGGPWIITIDNFLNITEANRLIELGANVGYSRSTDSGNILEDGTFELIVTEDRTSTNAWCDTKVCNNDPIAITVYDRIEKLIKIPMSYSEEFQLLRYEKGQFYNEHHDYNEYEYDLIQGKYKKTKQTKSFEPVIMIHLVLIFLLVFVFMSIMITYCQIT